MKIIIGCEESQTITKAFRKKGHQAFSCDLKECSGGHPEWHIRDNILNHLNGYNLYIIHPPCTRLANSGVRWLKECNLWEELEEAIKFFNIFVELGKSGKKVMIENPIQHCYARTKIEKYHQIIHPWQFGHMEQKTTCLWLYNLPKLKETNNVYEQMMKLPYKERAKIHYCSPGMNRSTIRSKTYPGIADALANQFG